VQTGRNELLLVASDTPAIIIKVKWVSNFPQLARLAGIDIYV
jgi:Ankyrin repeats (3 copies)/Ankyrin repeat